MNEVAADRHDSTVRPGVHVKPDPANSGSSAPAALSVGQRLLIWIGGLGPIGALPASGTVAVGLVGVPLVVALRFAAVPEWMYLTLTLSLTAIAIWVHEIGDRILGEKDSRRLVWDELARFMVACVMLPVTWQTMASAFLLERMIDIAKIPPAKQIEDRVPGGWGVVGDDIIAGLYTLLILQAVRHWQPGWLGL